MCAPAVHQPSATNVSGHTNGDRNVASAVDRFFEEMKMSKFKHILAVIWHGTSIAIEAASLLQSSGVLKVSGKANTALYVASAIEQAADNKANRLFYE